MKPVSHSITDTSGKFLDAGGLAYFLFFSVHICVIGKSSCAAGELDAQNFLSLQLLLLEILTTY